MSEEWEVPGDAEVDEVLRALINPQLRVRFFTHLENPKWLAPLTARGQFVQPPPVVSGADGVQRAAGWPEGNYLVRVTADEPETVSAILQAHATSANPWVQRAIVQAATRLPATLAVQHVSALCSVIDSGLVWIDYRPVVALASDLITAGQPAAGRRLLKSLFEPRATESTGLSRRGRVTAGARDHWYEQLLPQALPGLEALGINGLRLLAGWLLSFLDIRDERSSARGFDGSFIWRPSIAPHEQNHGFDDIGDALIDALGQLGRTLAARDGLQPVVDFLLARNEVLLTRIAVYVAALAIQGDPDAADMELGGKLLLTPSRLELSLRPEYVALAGAVVPRLTEPERHAWEMLVLAGAWESDEEYERLASWGQPAGFEPTAALVDEARERTVYRLLAGLPRGLSAAVDARFAELSDQFGPMDHPNFASFTTSFTGPSSPVTAAELAAMSGNQLVNYLAEWQPGGRRGGEPSVEGLARVLTDVTAEQPDLVAGISARLPTLGRSYIRAAFSGWARAAKEHSYRPSDDVWRLAQELAGYVDADPNQAESFEGHDQLWAHSQRACLSLVEEVLRRADTVVDATTAEAVFAVIAPLTRSPDPTPVRESQDRDGNMDALTRSLNALRPAAVRCLILLSTRLPADAATPAMSDILHLLADHVGPARDASLAVAAALGEGLGRIANAAPEWLEARIDDLLGGLTAADSVQRHWSDVAFSVAVRMYHPGAGFFALMRPWFERALSENYDRLDHVEGWSLGDSRSTLEEVGRHIVSAFLAEEIDLDEPLLLALFEPAREKLAAEVLGVLGWSADRAGFSDDELRRSRELIEWRLTAIGDGHRSRGELRQFYWWVRSEQYAPAWWLPILLEAAEDPGFDPNGMLGETLTDASAAYPGQVLAVLDRLLADDSDGRVYDLLQASPTILSNALQAGDAALTARAERLLDRLGRQGHLDLVAAVEAQRDHLGRWE